MTKVGTTITGSGRQVRSCYSEVDAELKLTIVGTSVKVVLDESDCDNLLRVYEYSRTPTADICEFFTDVERVKQTEAYALTEHFIAYAQEIAHYVYVD